MRRVLLGLVLAVFGCDDDGSGGDESTSTTGATTSSADASSGGANPTASTTTSTGGTDGGAGSGSTSEPGTGSTDGGAETTGAEDTGSSGGATSTGADAAIGFAEIQIDLENAGGAQGAYPSCIVGASCHSNPARNVVLVADPTPEQLMQNYQNILSAPATPWVTPMDDTAQMLNEVAIPDDVRARWLAWIEDGAPFE